MWLVLVFSASLDKDFKYSATCRSQVRLAPAIALSSSPPICTPEGGRNEVVTKIGHFVAFARREAIILPAVSPSSRPSASEDDELPSSWVKGGSGELSKVLGKDTVRGPITGRADLGVGVVEVTPIQTRADLSNTVTVAVTASVEVVFEVRSKVGRPTEIVLTRIGEAFDCARADILALYMLCYSIYIYSIKGK